MSIDKEPAFVHPHCLPGCGMNRADESNQCGDGCILIVVYGEASGVLNPRVPVKISVAEVSEIIYGDSPLVKAALEYGKKPWYKRYWILMQDWWWRHARR